MDTSLSSYALARPGENRLIEALPAGVRSALLERVQRVPLALSQPVYERGGPIDHAYFPIDGIISSTTVFEDGGSVEVGVVGAEGFVGTQLLLETQHSDNRVFVQVAGEAMRIRGGDLLRLCQQHRSLRDLLLRYTSSVLSQTGQIAACNRVHEAEERFSRWLLMVQDRVAADKFLLTQEFMALMLGTRRATVTLVAGVLQRAGIIRYTRGHIQVLNREELEGVACECYRRNREYSDSIFLEMPNQRSRTAQSNK